MPRVERDRDERDDRRKKYTKFRKDNRCRFCRDQVGEVDYKDLQVLFKLCTGQGKLYSRKRSGNCAYHQRSAQAAVKRARFMAMLPYVGTGSL
ncbi:MAG TPA: 30S ribosomal protein S18 [Planctomycetota bacterium]|jgi:small subunit ribosomal protein S18|nr:30S ribosomal protein S18 [Planctomycetota bacterium]